MLSSSPSPADTTEFGLGERIVIDLTTGLEGNKYHIYFEDFISLVNLMEKMKNNELYCCGIVCANRKGLPKLKAEKELRQSDSDYAARSDGIHCLRWKDKRCIQLHSTICKGGEVTQISGKDKDGSVTQVTCPNLVAEYNKFMGCMNKADMFKSLYAIDRKKRK
jgi:hypothetical protein